MKKVFKRILIGIAILYIIVLIGIYFVQEKLLFNPDKLSESHVFRAGQELELEVAPQIALNCISIDNPNDNGVILYLHGNRGSNRRCLRQLMVYDGLGYDLFMPDYRSYGKSDGFMLSQEQAYGDMQVVYNHLKERYGEDRITILGYSLGSSMASHLAATNNPKALHLVAPYKSLIAMKNKFAPVIPSFLLKYPFRNDKNLTNVSCPVTLYHAPNDELIPYDHARSLSEINPSFKLIDLPGSGHRGSIFNDAVRRNID